MAETIYILLGSNTGNREKNLETAIQKIKDLPGMELTATSAVYITEPVSMVGENPSFLNQVVMAEYEYLPNELLAELEKIEVSMGRIEKGEMKPRPIDLDILLFGEQMIKSENLIIPHKELLNRAFAMIPL
ncbi:MAG: 2-amino-4-hydroxy-6-hydroxymethyldihydropteridine diphosphokinase [Calditrichaeota bacterium]|nr:MAG: 2-amino-4-hydroxy-6-hydroxymethyldihydropteridine diphosphokinase [Calditrichota bacterium]